MFLTTSSTPLTRWWAGKKGLVVSAVREAKRKIARYQDLNRQRLDYPDIFAFSPDNDIPESPLRWVKCKKIDLAEVLYALFLDRALSAPNGLIPDFNKLIGIVGKFLNLDIGESADLARRIRGREDPAKYLHRLADLILKEAAE